VCVLNNSFINYNVMITISIFIRSLGKEFLIPIEKGELLIMMGHVGLCRHKCEEGQFTVVIGFVLQYDATREVNINGGLDGKFEKMICDFAEG